MSNIIVSQLCVFKNEFITHITHTGLRIFSHNPPVSFNIWVDPEGKVEMSDTVSKEDFLDLMSKLYDMAEVK